MIYLTDDEFERLAGLIADAQWILLKSQVGRNMEKINAQNTITTKIPCQDTGGGGGVDEGSNR